MSKVWDQAMRESYFDDLQTLRNQRNQLRSITMTDSNVDPHDVAADPAEDHKTPGGQPGDHDAPEPSTETVVETPGGTTVTETPSDS
jgi:hypothetical protein